MLISFAAIIAGLALLVWSADRFVEGAATSARYLGMSPLLIGMVIIGFGTSAPEMVVSAMAASAGNPGIALGNAYGSNITNIALILGITAVISPFAVHSRILRNELPLLLAITGLAAWQLWDGEVSRLDAIILLLVFAIVMGWTIIQGMRQGPDALGSDTEAMLETQALTFRQSIIWLLIGLVLLIVSSRLLVWGAVDVAQAFGVSDLIIGLTVVAVGTSLPELASSISAIRKGEHDLALGNVLGSNLFNTLAVVGIAGVIQPMRVGPEVLQRDVLLMALLTFSLLVFGFRFKGLGRINRLEGGLLILVWLAYTAYLIQSTFIAG